MKILSVTPLLCICYYITTSADAKINNYFGKFCIVFKSTDATVSELMISMLDIIHRMHNCTRSYDHLKISVGRPVKHSQRLCGTTLHEGEVIKTDSSVVTLEFVSDSNFNEAGFKIEYFTNAVKDVAKGTCYSYYIKLVYRRDYMNVPRRVAGN